MAWPFPPWAASAAMTRAPASPGHARRSGRWTRRRPPPPRRPGAPRRRRRSGRRRSSGPPGRRWRPRCGPGCTPRSAGPLWTRPAATASNWACEYRPGPHRVRSRSACRHHRSPGPTVWTRTVGPASGLAGAEAPGARRAPALTAAALFVQNGGHHPERLRDRAQRRRGNQNAIPICPGRSGSTPGANARAMRRLTWTLFLGCAAVNVDVPILPRRCMCATSASDRSR